MILIFWPVHIKGTQSSFVSHLRIITTLTSNSIGQLCPLSFFIHMESYQKSVSVGAWLPLLNIVLWDSPMLLRISVDCTFSLGYSIELCLGLIYKGDKWQHEEVKLMLQFPSKWEAPHTMLGHMSHGTRQQRMGSMAAGTFPTGQEVKTRVRVCGWRSCNMSFEFPQKLTCKREGERER